MKLHCFNCGRKFRNKKEIFRTSSGYPFCEDCFYDYLSHDWMDDFIETIIKEVREKFNGSYNRWNKDFFKTNEKCDGCSEKNYGYMYYPKESQTKLNGKNYCEICIESIEAGGTSNEG